jgi:hypothetical protein
VLSKLPSAAEFFSRFVATRTPVVLRGAAAEAAGLRAADWDLEALRAAVGKESVMVELASDQVATRAGGAVAAAGKAPSSGAGRKRARAEDAPRADGAPTRFGTGVREPMRFDAFVDALRRGGSSSLYLNTQPLPEGADGLPTAVLGAPLAALPRASLPLRPPLLPTLAPSSINLWLGAAREGSSSGLHHDFHENLYVLLRGRKVFSLAPPADVARM